MFSIMCDFSLIIIAWLKLVPSVECYSVHVQEKEAGILIQSLGQNGTCTLEQVIAPGFTSTLVEADTAAGLVFASRSPDCRGIPANPLTLSTVSRCTSIAPGFTHLVINRYDVHVHGRHCHNKRKSRTKPDADIISLLSVPGYQKACYGGDTALFPLGELLPNRGGMQCSVTAGSDFFVRDGQFFLSRHLCLKHGTLLQLDLHCDRRSNSVPHVTVVGGIGDIEDSEDFTVHWRIGLGSSHEEHLEELLDTGAGVGSGGVSRQKRNVNTSPQFQPPIYQASVPENKPGGTPVVLLKAEDSDEGEAGRLEYFIDALFDSRSERLFAVDPDNGAVTTVEVLDRETKDTHVFRVTAVDHGKPRRTAVATLTIVVSDTNDHDPVFEQQDYKESIRENLEIGYEVLTVRATDGDAPINGNILYRILNSDGSNEVFEIDPRSGVIRTKGSVDREQVEAYTLLVEADDQGRDPGPRSATATVRISVEDDNDNAPQFSEKRYVVQVPENIPANTEILQVSAMDRDRGSNAVVHYSIMSGNTRGQFYIDAQTGKMDVVGQLDYETNKEYTLRIRAQDGGRPPLSNISGLVTVQVLDVNDNAPIFVSTPFQASVLENVPAGYSVIHIQAIDADSGENSRLEYLLIETMPGFPFSINNSTGWIMVSDDLDRERVDFYNFAVEARDHGSPPMSSTASVTMTVLDVNDNKPEFTQRAYYLRLNEDAAVGTSVVMVSAVDRDVNSVVTYQISGGNTRNRFAITSQSGGALISLALPLDYKLERQYVLSVTASDGMLFDTGQVYINITDANTHRPVFQSSHYTVNINENMPVGTTVVMISATDEDTGENSRITYVMEDSIPQFSIHPATGAVTTQMELDYEDQVSYTLAITAQDNGIPQKSDTTYLEISVIDVNDNSPQFLQDQYQGSITEDVPVYTSVVQVSATDRDSGLNGRVLYTFQGGDDGDGDFIIESTSGIVRTLRRLDRENVPKYDLRAFAVDKGFPALKTPVDIQVTVLDVNDNPPVFEKDEFDILVEENSPIGLVVAHISASDPDEGSNAQIMYQIVEGNIPEVFQLDIFSGELTALMDLDYEAHSEYVIVVQATSAPLVSRATVHIKLIDKNDNPPVLKNFQIIFNHYVTNKSSSFPSGAIGHIPAHDPDVLDRLHYRFEAGNELNLVILNQSTGELRLSHDLNSNRPLEASMKISVSDGVHAVSAQCLLKVTIITDEMLTNSITLRLANTSQELFLSLLLARFLDSVAHVLSASRHDVVVFNVQDDTDVRAGILNVSLSATAGGRRAGFLGSEELQERLYLNRSLLARLSSQHVLPFDDNICLREPCQNYMKCVSVLKFDSLAPFVASDAVLFRPIQPVAGLRCRCPRGFTGDYCETEIDLCYSQPCGEHGVCHSFEGGFTCQCHEGHTGGRCELSSHSGRCVPGVCKNGGSCVNLLVGGFRCECPPGAYDKPFCQMSARGFPPQSFVTFRGLRQRFHFTISLTFATVEKEGLLLYNGRFNEKHDFVAMEIVDGQVQMTFSAGETKTTVSPFIQGGVSDGQWHVVQIHYYNKPVLSQAGLPQGPSEQKIAVVTVDDCDTSVALKFGHMIGNYSCAAQGSQSGSKKSLDLTGPLLLGGVPRLPEDFPVRNRQFVGCMKDLQIDRQLVDMAGYIANNGTVPGCPSKREFCSKNPCLNGGTCVNQWASFVCRCPLGFGGPNCEREMGGPQRFQGNGLMQWSNLEAVAAAPWCAEMMFRSRQASGTLLWAAAAQHYSISLHLRDGYVTVVLQRGEDSFLSCLDAWRADDGEWHHLQVEIRGGGTAAPYQAIMSLDYGLNMASMDLDSKLRGLKLKTLSVGGVPALDGTVQHGFRGCLQGLRMGETPSSAVSLSFSRARRLNAQRGCDLPDPCHSNPCPANSDCKTKWDGYTCTCRPGYYGDRCTDVCFLNPCENQSICVRKPDTARGFACHCPSNYFGQYCETRIDQPCPRGWWGHSTCGPCSCRPDQGFHADCNKTNGECRCKDNHYRPVGSASCLRCDCYAVGSLSRACDPLSGQCPCKPGVMGRRCDRCDNPFAEVSATGCEVIYDSCPQTMEADVWWPRTRFGLPAAVSCPKGSIGTAIRHCDEHQGWLPPDLFNCTSLTFSSLKAASDELSRDPSLLDTARARQMAAALWNASENTAQYYGGDVQLAYSLTLNLLRRERGQRGFRLAATQDVSFTENLVSVGSSILAPVTWPHWEMIQRTEGATASLLRAYEEYANTLAQNMRRTYLRPFTVVTPNIVLSVDRLDKDDFSGARLPRYGALGGMQPTDPDTSVTLPDMVFIKDPAAARDRPLDGAAGRGRRHPGGGAREAVASVIIFHSLASLLPARYDPDKRSLRVPKRPVINTPVVSIMVHDDDEPFHRPVIVHFRLSRTEERAKPVCVFWNHSLLAAGDAGGWSAKGCELVFRNYTHISCRCSHMTSFAVLMDVSQRENGEILPAKFVTWGSVGVTLTFLLLTILLLGCFRTVRSNRSNIACNGTAALLLSELLFVLGINQADSPVLCTGIAILLHFLYTCTFAWLFLESLHTYRMLSEARDVNHGPMRFYYVIGWGIPAFVTGLSVGLDPEGHGNPDFCWLSVYDTLIWSFAGPVILAVSMSIFLYILTAKASHAIHRLSLEKKGPVLGLRTACIALLLVTVTCLLALLSVNSESLILHYLFAVFNCVQGPFIFFFRIVFDKEARRAMRCCGHKHKDMMSSKSLASSCNYSAPYLDSRLYQPPFGDSRMSHNGTVPSGKSQLSYAPFLFRDDRGLNVRQGHLPLTDRSSLLREPEDHADGHASDSDSEASLEDDRSGSFASSRSSDSEGEGPYPAQACWENNMAVLSASWLVQHEAIKDNQHGLSDAECLWSSERLEVESLSNPHPAYPRTGRQLLEEGPEDRGAEHGRGNMQLFLQGAYPQRGILKRKPLSPIVERNSLIITHDMLSPRTPCPAPASSRSSSSDGRRGGGVGSPQELSGGVSLAPVAMSIKAGTVDGDSSGSES
ncbi:cadherin EGF LAG seven-pass G-type receptor 2 isoform X1 [Paramormyrops kingsleyae]|uniref:cadherin EGF LAG seven-pass G-type receptor 2 isoform X1 n=1 Tax=Paramormyrops kingsleyae TaxID=1676925 RepID=UPI003B9702BF